MYKRRTALFLICLILLSVSSYSAFAADSKTEGVCGEQVTYQWDAASKTLIISGSGAMKDYTEQQNITPWKSFSNDIETLVIEKGVTSVGAYSFPLCASLTNIQLPDGLLKIGDGAFGWATSLDDIRLPNSLQSIGASAFVWCSNITKITIPDSVSKIGKDAFLWCTKLNQILVNESNPNFKTVDGILYNKQMTELLVYPAGKPSEHLDLPEGIAKINPSAFAIATLLSSVSFPNSLEQIGESAFFGCKSLKQASFSEGLTVLGTMAFYGTALEDVSLPDSVTTIGTNAFKNCTALKRVIVGKNATNLGEALFDGTENFAIQGYSGSPIQAYANKSGIEFHTFTKVLLNGEELIFDEKPVVINGRTLVPMRVIFEKLGASIFWDEKTQTASAEKNGTLVTIQIGSPILNVGQTEVALDVPARLIGNRTLVPLRAVSEAFDVEVSWDGPNYTAVLNEK